MDIPKTEDLVKGALGVVDAILATTDRVQKTLLVQTLQGMEREIPNSGAAVDRTGCPPILVVQGPLEDSTRDEQSHIEQNTAKSSTISTSSGPVFTANESLVDPWAPALESLLRKKTRTIGKLNHGQNAGVRIDSLECKRTPFAFRNSAIIDTLEGALVDHPGPLLLVVLYPTHRAAFNLTKFIRSEGSLPQRQINLLPDASAGERCRRKRAINIDRADVVVGTYDSFVAFKTHRPYAIVSAQLSAKKRPLQALETLLRHAALSGLCKHMLAFVDSTKTAERDRARALTKVVANIQMKSVNFAQQDNVCEGYISGPEVQSRGTQDAMDIERFTQDQVESTAPMGSSDLLPSSEACVGELWETIEEIFDERICDAGHLGKDHDSQMSIHLVDCDGSHDARGDAIYEILQVMQAGCLNGLPLVLVLTHQSAAIATLMNITLRSAEKPAKSTILLLPDLLTAPRKQNLQRRLEKAKLVIGTANALLDINLQHPFTMLVARLPATPISLNDWERLLRHTVALGRCKHAYFFVDRKDQMEQWRAKLVLHLAYHADNNTNELSSSQDRSPSPVPMRTNVFSIKNSLDSGRKPFINLPAHRRMDRIIRYMTTPLPTISSRDVHLEISLINFYTDDASIANKLFSILHEVTNSTPEGSHFVIVVDRESLLQIAQTKQRRSNLIGMARLPMQVSCASNAQTYISSRILLATMEDLAETSVAIPHVLIFMAWIREDSEQSEVRDILEETARSGLCEKVYFCVGKDGEESAKRAEWLADILEEMSEMA